MTIKKILEWSSSLSLWAASVVVIPTIAKRLRVCFSEHMLKMFFLTVPIVWVVAMTATFCLTYISAGVPPHLRVQNVTYAMFLLGWFVTGSLVAVYLQHNHGLTTDLSKLVTGIASVALVISLLSAPNVVGAFADVPRVEKLQEFLASRYRVIQEQYSRGVIDIEVPKRKYWFYALWEDELQEDPSYWGNQCVATYFGVRSIRLH